MRPVPLFRFHSRARITSWGIAFCTMFIVASFSIVAGLDRSMEALTDNFSSEMSMVTLPGEDGLMPFAKSEISGLEERTAFGMFAWARSDSSPQMLPVFSVDDPSGVLGESFAVSGTDVLIGPSLSLSGAVRLEAQGSVVVDVVGRASSTMFPSDWILASEDVLRSLLVLDIGECNFCIMGSLSASEARGLVASGFSVQQMPGIIEFLESSVSEIRSDALWVLAPSAVVIAVLAYGFIGSEMADRRHEIGIIKTIGATRRVILVSVLRHCAAITLWGALLGLALGVVLSYAFSTAASSVFDSAFLMEVEEPLLLLSFAAAMGAGLLGGLLPALRMSMSSPVEDLKEVARFS
jgi:hypothetical protein